MLQGQWFSRGGPGACEFGRNAESWANLRCAAHGLPRFLCTFQDEKIKANVPQLFTLRCFFNVYF